VKEIKEQPHRLLPSAITSSLLFRYPGPMTNERQGADGRKWGGCQTSKFLAILEELMYEEITIDS
jgi:hypothetical protein